jgi:hypothetical protein
MVQPRISSRMLRRLRRADWDSLWLQGLIWARREARRYRGFGLSGLEREIVQTAIEKTFSGERLWKHEVCDLPHHLRMTIRSLYNNEAKKVQARQRYAQLERAGRPSAGGTAKSQETLDRLRSLLSLLREADPALAEFFLEASRLLLGPCDTEREVAESMDLSPSQFSKRKARIAALVAADRQRRAEQGAAPRRTI